MQAAAHAAGRAAHAARGPRPLAPLPARRRPPLAVARGREGRVSCVGGLLVGARRPGSRRRGSGGRPALPPPDPSTHHHLDPPQPAVAVAATDPDAPPSPPSTTTPSEQDALRALAEVEREEDVEARGDTVALTVAGAAALGAAFWYLRGPDVAGQYFAGYLLEQSLSVDNLFVFVLVFRWVWGGSVGGWFCELGEWTEGAVYLPLKNLTIPPFLSHPSFPSATSTSLPPARTASWRGASPLLPCCGCSWWPRAQN